MNYDDLHHLDDLQSAAQMATSVALENTERGFAIQEHLNQQAVRAIDAFAARVNMLWPEMRELLVSAIPPPQGIAGVAHEFARIACEEMNSGSNSVVVRLDKVKHGIK